VKNLTMMAALLLASLHLSHRTAVAQSGPDAVPDSVTPERVAAGSEIFNNGTCVACHAVAGMGVGRWAPNLSDREWLHSEGDYDGIMHTIFWGVEKDQFKAVTPRRFQMNPQGGMQLTPEQLKALVAYVWTISRPSTNSLVAAQQQFVTLARSGKAADAAAMFEAARKKDPDLLLLAENALNRLGYELLPDAPKDALALFQLNARAHPDSWNVYDSLGEAEAALGNKAEAVRNYQQSLKLNPKNDNAAKKLKELQGS